MPDIHHSQVGGGSPRVPKGTVVYRLGADPCIGTGIKWTPEESRDALDGPVADVLNDVAGSRIVKEALGPLVESEFDTGRIDANAPRAPQQSYRLGEAIGDAYLSTWRNCTFPWPLSRDSRRPSASPPGPDLVGVKIETGRHYLVFGEVKTSNQEVYPPRVMQGQAGLLQQLKDLRVDTELHRHLIEYLLLRCTGPVRDRVIAAAHRYLANHKDCRFFGVLVRDVRPDVRDLQQAVSHLEHDFPAATRVEVLAMYLPPGHLDPVVGGSTSSDGGNS